MNVRRHALNTLSILAVVAAAVALTSCAEDPAGIFSRVVNEKPISNNMTKALQYSSPSFVARLGDSYYAGVGVFWAKADGQANWTNEVTLPAAFGSATVLAGSGTVVGGTMYVLFTDSLTGNGLGVWSTANGTDWTKVAGLPTDRYIRSIMAANGTLFAIAANGRSTSDAAAYSIYYLDGGSFVASSIADSAAIGLPSSVAYVSGSYWFAAGAALVSGASAGALSVAATEPPSGDSSYSGVCAYDSGVIVSTRTGYLNYYDGAAWTSAGPFVNAKDKVFSLSEPTYVASDKVLLVGTNMKPRGSSDTPPVDGYLEFDLSGGFSAAIAPLAAHSIVSDATNFAASLSGTSITSMPSFDLGGGKRRIFALTDGVGPWSNTYENGAWGGWVRE